MKKTILLTLALLSILVPSAWAGQSRSSSELFFKANQDFKQGSYNEAIKVYEEIAASGLVSGHLSYNLGCAYFKAGRIGKAVLNYERAKLMIPRDADLSFNLVYANDRRTDASAPPVSAVSSVFFWLGTFSLSELFRIFAATHLALFGALAVRVFRKREATYYLLMTCLFFWFACGVSFGLKYYEAATDSRSVVVGKQADVLAGPDAGDTVLFRLHEGTIVVGERYEPSWCLVSLADGKRGWIRAGDIEEIVSGRFRPRLF